MEDFEIETRQPVFPHHQGKVFSIQSCAKELGISKEAAADLERTALRKAREILERAGMTIEDLR